MPSTARYRAEGKVKTVTIHSQLITAQALSSYFALDEVLISCAVSLAAPGAAEGQAGWVCGSPTPSDISAAISMQSSMTAMAALAFAQLKAQICSHQHN